MGSLKEATESHVSDRALQADLMVESPCSASAKPATEWRRQQSPQTDEAEHSLRPIVAFVQV